MWSDFDKILCKYLPVRVTYYLWKPSNTSDFLHWSNDPNAAQDLGIEGKELDAGLKFYFCHDMSALNFVWYLL